MKNGVFQLSMADYLKSPGVSQSALKRLAYSPAHLREYLDNPKPSTRDQMIGTLEHVAVFEPDLLAKSYYARPDKYPSEDGTPKKWNGNAKFCKEWIAKHSDRLVISGEEEQRIMGMRDAVRFHPIASKALEQGKAEQSLFVVDPDTGLQLKCRTDFLTGNAIVDLKKTQDARPFAFSRTVVKYGYDVQAAFNLDVAGMLNIGVEHFVFIAVEDQPPHGVMVYELDAESIGCGRSKYRRWLAQFLACIQKDSWPAYRSDQIAPLTLPAYAFKDEDQQLMIEDREILLLPEE